MAASVATRRGVNRIAIPPMFARIVCVNDHGTPSSFASSVSRWWLTQAEKRFAIDMPVRYSGNAIITPIQANFLPRR